MPRCAFLTIANQDGWFIDDDLVHEPLRHLGWEITDVVWNADVIWDAFDVVVIRSPWDYQRDLHQFLSVLRRIEDSSAALYNSLKTVLWNVDKHYLFDLHRNGTEIVPTLRMGTPTANDVHNALRHFGTGQIVLKPSIGANADDTFRVSRETPKSEIAKLCEVLSAKTYFAQPFMPGITAEGEFSLVYFDGCLSHSILKTVPAGDFRVQEEHGGGVVCVQQPEPELIAAADRVIATLTELPLYARVDLVRTRESTFALMELELIEPCLYFKFAEHSARAFAAAIVERYLRKSAI